MLLVAVSTGGGDVGVYRCCNLGMVEVWVVVLLFSFSFFSP